jgi:hypothetical protein
MCGFFGSRGTTGIVARAHNAFKRYHLANGGQRDDTREWQGTGGLLARPCPLVWCEYFRRLLFALPGF